MAARLHQMDSSAFIGGCLRGVLCCAVCCGIRGGDVSFGMFFLLSVNVTTIRTSISHFFTSYASADLMSFSIFLEAGISSVLLWHYQMRSRALGSR